MPKHLTASGKTRLSGLARGVRHFPVGAEAREISWAVKFAVRNPDLKLWVGDAKWIADGYFLRWRGCTRADVKDVGPMNLDAVTLREWRARGGKGVENAGGVNLGQAWELRKMDLYPFWNPKLGGEMG